MGAVELYLVSRTPAPLELFVVESDASNLQALLEWGEGELATIGVRLAGGLEIGTYFSRDDAGTTVRTLTGCSWGKEWHSFMREPGELPSSVLGKNAHGFVHPYRLDELKLAGYDLSILDLGFSGS